MQRAAKFARLVSFSIIVLGFEDTAVRCAIDRGRRIVVDRPRDASMPAPCADFVPASRAVGPSDIADAEPMPSE